MSSILARFHLPAKKTGATVSASEASSRTRLQDDYLTAATAEIPREVLDADKLHGAGNLNFEEATAGGLGRHLGLFSTTFLMWVVIFSLGRILTNIFGQHRKNYWNGYFLAC